jgi:hypothetical protein
MKDSKPLRIKTDGDMKICTFDPVPFLSENLDEDFIVRVADGEIFTVRNRDQLLGALDSHHVFDSTML